MSSRPALSTKRVPRQAEIDIVYSNQNMVLLVQNRHADQWNKMEDPNISTRNYGRLIFNKESKKETPEERDSIFKKWCW